jgi:hypothetical protein
MIALDEVPLADEDHDRAFMDVWIQDFGACALSAADQLRIFDAVADGSRTPRQLAQSLRLDQAAVTALCRALVAMDSLSPDADGFELTSSARLFWLRRSPCYRGREFDRHRDWEQHQRIVETLESGWAPLLDTDESFTDAWRRGEVSEESADSFTRVMHSMILTPSLAAVRSGAFAQVRHLVDVGGGSGALAAALIAHQPQSRATVMDLEPVCAASRRILAETSTGNRVEYFPASFFDDPWPRDADAFSLSNILHDWPIDTCRQLLDRALDALPAGGALFVHEALLDDSQCSPRMTAIFNLLMHMNHRGQQFTRNGLFALLEERGFCKPRVLHSYSYWSVIAADKPGH